MLGSTPAEAKPFAYVTHFLSNTVSVIDTATNIVVATVLVGLRPAGVAITPDGTHAYVTNAGDHTVSVIETATNTLVASVLLPGFVGEPTEWRSRRTGHMRMWGIVAPARYR
jgi:YVTN family beta-propeller protein